MTWRSMRAMLGMLGLMAVLPTCAKAGLYEVRSCAASSIRSAAAWEGSVTPGEQFFVGNYCVTQQPGATTQLQYGSSLWVRPTLTATDPESMTTGRAAGYRLRAPTNASLRAITYRRSMTAIDQAWAVRLTADAAVIDECWLGPGGPQGDCIYEVPGDSFARALGPGTQALDFAVHCVLPFCTYGLGPIDNAAGAISSSIVTIEENVAPTVSALAVSPNGAGWVGGAGQATLSGADHLGIRRLELIRAGAVVATFPNPACVDWSTRPCAEPTTGAGTTYAPTVNAAALGLADGEHSVRVRAIDAAGNATVSAPVTLKLDTTAPLAAFLLGGGAEPGATRTLTWATPVPGEGSPLVQTRVLLCPPGAGPANCTAHQPTGERAFSFQLPNDGDRVDARVEITDAAGNVAVTPPTLFERRASATGPGTTPPGDPNSGPSPSPGPGTTPPAKRSPRLTARFRRTLSKGPFTIRGSVTRGAASRITVTASGRSRTGKVVRTRVRIKPRASGGYSVRVRLPARMVRKRGLRIEIVAKPNATYRAATLRRTLREPRR